MFNAGFMTEAEKKGTLKYINDVSEACRVDDDVILEAMSDEISFNLLLHINMMKCKCLLEMKEPIFPFTKEDYITICQEEKEEDRRTKLCEILSKKHNEYFKQESEPLLPCIEEADNDPKNIELENERLKSFIERIERLEEEKNGISSDIRDIYAEAKAVGFDTKIMRALIKLRRMNAADRAEQDFLLDTYRKALEL